MIYELKKDTKAQEFEMQVREDIHSTWDPIQYDFTNTQNTHAPHSSDNVVIGKIILLILII